jgi:hypothetical protein
VLKCYVLFQTIQISEDGLTNQISAYPSYVNSRFVIMDADISGPFPDHMSAVRLFGINNRCSLSVR